MERVSESQTQHRLHASPNSMYFDFLPTEVLPSIIKHVLLDARLIEEGELEEDIYTSSSWRKGIFNLSMLLSGDSPFREELSKLPLAEVQLGAFSDASCMSVDKGFLVVGPELFENEALKLGIPEQMLQVRGESVKVVSFCFDSRDLPPGEAENMSFVQQFATLVKKYCPNVEKLNFDSLAIERCPYPFEDVVHELLEQFSSQLTTIEWNLDITDESILHPPDIRMCTNIRKLQFPACPQLIPFLCSCGASLQSLTLSSFDPDEYAEILDVIQHNCTKLSEVWLLDYLAIIQEVGEERYAKFLCSFGSQLIHATVNQLSAEKLDQVVRACPNLLIHLLSVHKNGVDEWERVIMFGSMIKYLSVNASICYDEKCKKAIVECKNLESLTVTENHTDEYQGIEKSRDLTFLLSLLAPSLSSLCWDGFNATQQNICMLSSALRNLRNLILNLAKPIESGIDFETIAHSNPKLKSVTIEEWIYNDEMRERDQSIAVLRMLVGAFSKCRYILFTLVGNSGESITRNQIQDICGSLPCRGVYAMIQVGSTRYEQAG